MSDAMFNIFAGILSRPVILDTFSCLRVNKTFSTAMLQKGGILEINDFHIRFNVIC